MQKKLNPNYKEIQRLEKKILSYRASRILSYVSATISVLFLVGGMLNFFLGYELMWLYYSLWIVLTLIILIAIRDTYYTKKLKKIINTN